MKLRFNSSEALERLGDDRELFNAVVSTYLREGPAYLRGIEEALENKDTHAVGVAAHKMKGASAAIGMECMVELTLSLEKAGKNGQSIESLHTQFDALKAHYENTAKPALQSWVG